MNGLLAQQRFIFRKREIKPRSFKIFLLLNEHANRHLSNGMTNKKQDGIQRHLSVEMTNSERWEREGEGKKEKSVTMDEVKGSS